MPLGIARSNICRFSASRAGYSCGVAVLVFVFGCRGLQNAVADGDTRTITMHHVHSDENITPQPGVALTPNQIVSARGSWDSTDDGTRADRAAALRGAAFARSVLIASVAHSAGTITPPLGALEDRVSPDLLLAYTAQSNQSASAATPQSLVEAQAQPPQPTPGTTIVVKRADYQAVSTIITSRPPSANEGSRFDNPWLDAILISPSVRRYLTVLTLGMQDYRSLAALVEKPARSVMMTFGAEPNPGMTNDRFSGSAIVFISTVTYQAQTDTALLQ